MPLRRPASRAWRPRARRRARSAAAPTSRAGTRAARLGCEQTVRQQKPSAERRDLGEEIGLVHGLHDVVARALAHAPDAVGFLAFARAQDHRDALGRLVARQDRKSTRLNSSHLVISY